MSHEVAIVLLALPLVAGLAMYGYIAFTGKWMTWPYRPRKIPATAQRRRLAGLAGVLFFIGLALLDSNLLPETGDVPAALFAAFPLFSAAAVLWVVGYKTPRTPTVGTGPGRTPT